MIATLGAFLQTVAVLAAASACGSLAVPPSVAVLRRLRVAPAARADLAVAVAALPAGAVLVVAVAVALPGAMELLGLVGDHCDVHGGHGHLCLAHPGGAAPSLVALGALATAGTLLRVARWTVARSAAARDLTALLRLGVPAAEGPDVIRVDGDTVLCHAAGAWAPRVLVSTPLLAGLTPELLAAALEHERAHLRRRDVLVRDLLAVLGSFAWPGAIAGAVAAWEQAAEEAADAAAADRFGGPLVASALVAVARLSLAPVPASMPAVGAGLHRRVRALLDCPRHRPAVALPVIPGLLLAIAAFAALNAESLHHAAETALHLLLRA